MIRFRLFSAITKNDAIFVIYDIFLYHTGIIKDSVREALIKMENEIIEKKEKLVSLVASAGECRDQGQSCERQQSFNCNIGIKFSSMLETIRVGLTEFIISMAFIQ